MPIKDSKQKQMQLVPQKGAGTVVLNARRSEVWFRHGSMAVGISRNVHDAVTLVAFGDADAVENDKPTTLRLMEIADKNFSLDGLHITTTVSKKNPGECTINIRVIPKINTKKTAKK